jgi:hypothetical protein
MRSVYHYDKAISDTQVAQRHRLFSTFPLRYGGNLAVWALLHYITRTRFQSVLRKQVNFFSAPIPMASSLEMEEERGKQLGKCSR